jgi:hypothetical protein
MFKRGSPRGTLQAWRRRRSELRALRGQHSTLPAWRGGLLGTLVLLLLVVVVALLFR